MTNVTPAAKDIPPPGGADGHARAPDSSSATGPSDTAHAAEGAEAACWEAWVRAHGQAVFGFCYARTGRHDVAEDLSQECFCRAWQARGRDPAAGRSRGYFLTIADRLVLDHLRRAGRRPTVRLEDAGVEPIDRNAPAATAEAAEARRQLRDALATLSEAQRRTLLLRYYGGLDFTDIARQLGCPRNTALSHCRRGLDALRRLLTAPLAGATQHTEAAP